MKKSSDNEDVTILVCCHKKDYYYDGPGFLPIQVGKALHPELDLGIQGDDEGDNISNMNPNFCELTAHYWYWKNCKHSKYVGLNHYRRYFDFRNKPHRAMPVVNISEQEIINNVPLIPNLDKIFESSDIILAQPTIYPNSLKNNYCYAHIIDDYNILKDVIRNKFPEYYDSFECVMNNTNELPHFNMFITSNHIFEEYSKWIFDVLFEVEKQVKISAYPFQARVFGYMSERLLKVYTYHNNLRIKYVPVMKVCDDKNESLLKNILRNIKNKFIFQISKVGTK